jgi:hypothetical protein
MPPDKNSFDSTNVISKEKIRKNIRNALTVKRSNTPSNIDTSTPLFTPLEEQTTDFINNFRKAGGVYIRCSKSDFTEKLMFILEKKKYGTLLNTNKSLNRILEDGKIHYTDYIETDKPVDALIVYSDLLISRSGSLVFSQKYSLYPSILNLGTDLIAISFSNRVVQDLQNGIKVMESVYNGKPFEFFEVITPSVKKDQEEYTPANPQIILFLIHNE